LPLLLIIPWDNNKAKIINEVILPNIMIVYLNTSNAALQRLALKRVSDESFIVSRPWYRTTNTVSTLSYPCLRSFVERFVESSRPLSSIGPKGWACSTRPRLTEKNVSRTSFEFDHLRQVPIDS